MIISDNITQYLHSLEQDRSARLEEMRAFAEQENVPIIRREAESFLQVLLCLLHAESVLEIGTGIAYSAIFMAECSSDLKKIVTIENYPPRIKIAKENLERFRKEEAEKADIELIEEDAVKAVEKIQGPFDLIFLDGPKAQYLSMLPDLLGLLRKGGILLADNVLQDGELVRSRYVTQRRDRTIHERMREFLYEVKHHPDLITIIVTVGDGMSVSLKKEDEGNE